MEAWRAIPETSGEYEVSDKGRVRSASRLRTQRTKGDVIVTRRLPGRPMRASDNGAGYQTVMLRIDGRGVRRYVHRLVLEAFVGPPPSPDHHGAHWDGDRSHNWLENLRWATPAENQADRERHGTLKTGLRATHCPKGHPKTGDNLRLGQHGDGICITCQRAASRKSSRPKAVSSTKRRSLPTAVRHAVISAAGDNCQSCGEATDQWEVDHIFPVHLGGGDEMDNLRAICIPCHRAKSARETTERAKADRVRRKHHAHQEAMLESSA